MTRPIPPQTAPFVMTLEGRPPRVYLDSVGVKTGGFGHTGPDVPPVGTTVTDAQAEAWLAADLLTAGRRLEQKIGAGVVADLTPNQYAAMVSFVFNLGTPGTTIWTRLRARQFDQIPVEMMRFVYAGGHKLQGLVNRRTAEVRLWSTDEPGSRHEDPPSSMTRAVDTPPVTSQPQHLAQSGTIWAGAGTAAAGAVTGITQVQALVNANAGASTLLAQIAGGLAMLVVALGVGVMVFRWLDHRAAKR